MTGRSFREKKVLDFSRYFCQKNRRDMNPFRSQSEQKMVYQKGQDVVVLKERIEFTQSLNVHEILFPFRANFLLIFLRYFSIIFAK